MAILKGNPKRGRPSKSDRLDQESIPCQVCLESAVRSIRRFLTLLETGLMLEKPELIIFIPDQIGDDQFLWSNHLQKILQWMPNPVRLWSRLGNFSVQELKLIPNVGICS